MQQSSAADEDVFLIREQAYDFLVAKRLAKLDERRAKWKARIKAYLDECRILANNASLSEAEVRQEIEGLAVSQFTATERLRLPNLESYVD